MTTASGQTVAGREEEIARYVEEVREALVDLPAAERDELLEDLPAHLAEAAAEDPTPLVQLLGAPSAYAAELRAAADPAATASGRQTWVAGWAARRQRAQALLRRLDERTGRLLGYERFSDFARLLAPAWWLVRGYLAAMTVVIVLDQRQELGLLPRLGGSTIVGLAILAAFVAGSVWLARRTARMGPWPRRTIHLVSAMLLLFGIASLVSIDENQRWGRPGPAPQVTHVYQDPSYPDLADVFVVDEQDRLLTDVRLLDQNGDPIDLGWTSCEDTVEYDQNGDPVLTYPRCPDQLPFWARALVPSPAPTPAPSPAPTATPTPTPTPTPTG